MTPPAPKRARSLSRATAWFGALLSATVLAAVALLVWHEHKTAVDADLHRAELRARVLADHASRSVGAASVLLRYLSGQLVYTGTGYASAHTETLMTQALVALPFVREIDLVDGDGRIVASSLPGNVGVALDLPRLGRLPVDGQEVLGSFTPGRGLQSLAASAAGKPASVGFIPLVRGFQTPSGQLFHLVALLNPDSFSSFQALTVNDPHAATYMVDYQGQVLASSGPDSAAPGTSLASHPVFAHHLPSVEHGSYVGQGVAPDSQVVAFRLAKDRPLVLLVEQPYEDTLATWQGAVRWFVLAAGLVVLFLAGVTALACRSFRSREIAELELDDARQDVVRRERDLHILLTSVQELIFRTDLEGRISYVNDRWGAVRGPGVVLGRPLQDLVDSVDRAAVAALFAPDSGLEVRSASASMQSAEGAPQRFDIAVVPLREAGRIVGFAGSAVDVTARVAAQQALQRQLRFVALLQEISPQPVATLDRSGRYLTVNQAWLEFTGRKRDEVVGRPRGHFMSAADAALHERHDEQLWRDGGNLRYEAGVRRRDGSVREVVVIKILVAGDEQQPASVLVTLVDVTEFREAERAVREARDAAEESSRAKSEFIANISHELRTPLQSILGFSELGARRARELPRLADMFDEVHRAGQRMLRLVNDLLDLSKIENRSEQMQLKRLDLRPLTADIARELAPLLEARHLTLARDVGESPLIVMADAARLQQVLRNVLANAIRFSPEHATIHLAADHGEDTGVCLTVADRGPGIPPDELDSIFEAFVQSSATKDSAGGTGLGLAICQRIVDAHGGQIRAANRDGGGAVITLTLPAVP